MSEKEYKEKCESMFAKNSILISEKDMLEYQCEVLEKENEKIREQFEGLLKNLIDMNLLKSWHYNGDYSYELTEDCSEYCRKIGELKSSLKKKENLTNTSKHDLLNVLLVRLRIKKSV